MLTVLNAHYLNLPFTKNVWVKCWSNIPVKKCAKMQVIDGMQGMKILLLDVKVNGTEFGKLKLEDILLHTIEKGDISQMLAPC